MGFDLSYMGTKRQLAPAVARIIANSPPGPMLDLFSGMCAIGSAVRSERAVWSNDIQHFAATVARCLFCSPTTCPSSAQTLNDLIPAFLANRLALIEMFEPSVFAEQHALTPDSCYSLLRYLRGASPSRFLGRRLPHAGLDQSSGRFPYRLFTATYADTYFGLSQCIEIDSIVFALDALYGSGTISADGRSWLLIALGKVMKNLSTTTGHFAQYLVPSTGNAKRYAQHRRRSVFQEWLHELDLLSGIQADGRHTHNRVFQQDALTLVADLEATAEATPTVVYADPPYSDDQYSRYYHVLETLVLYDYPATTGKGKYRGGRFQTGFSQRAHVRNAFRDLISGVARLGADLVLSYPKNGLLYDVGESPKAHLEEYYQRVETIEFADHIHSTMGASHGASRAKVTEVVYRASN